MSRPMWGTVFMLAAVSCAATTTERHSPPAQARGMSRREVVRKILPYNVRVFVLDARTPKRSASAVVVGTETSLEGAMSYVLTNAHVLDPKGLREPGLMVTVDGPLGSLEYSAEPVALGTVPQMDLALLRLRGVRLEPAELARDHEILLGDDVVVVAAPYGRALSVSGGMVSQVERDPSSQLPSMLKTDASIGYGASGGGVYSVSTGKLLAIVEGYRTAKVGFAVAERDYSFDVPMPGETFAAPVAKVRAFLRENGYGHLLSRGADERAASR